MKRRTLLSLLAMAFVACQDGRSPTDPGFEGANFDIVDGAHGGNVDVFFHPPLVPDPSGDPEFGNRDANPNLMPVARICEGIGAVCDPDDIGPDLDMVYDTDGEFYQVNWHTRDFDLANGTVYRITILLGSGANAIDLAMRDVTPVGTAKGSCKSKANCEFNNGSTLPIRVRIETGAACVALGGDPNNCATATVPAGGTVELAGVGSATPDDGGTINIQPCTDLRDRAAGNGRLDLPTFGPCIEIIPLDPDLTGIATLCDAFGLAIGAGSSLDQAGRMTVHRHSDGAAFAVALAHAEGPECTPQAPPQARELNKLERFVRLARSAWRGVSDRVAALFEPAPLYARTMFRCNRGGCAGPGDFRSSYQVALPSWMDFDPAGPSDGDFGDVLVGTGLTLSVNAFDSGEFEDSEEEDPDPEAVEGVRLTFTVTDGGSFTGPAACASASTCTLNTDEDGNAAVTIAAVLGGNTVEVTGLGVGTDGLGGTTLNVFGPSINDESGPPFTEVTLDEGTLEFTATGFEYLIEQGGSAFGVKTIEGGDNVVDFYDLFGASAHTGLEKSDVSIIFLYEEIPGGKVSLVMIHDVINDGSGGQVVFTFANEPAGASFIVRDDATGSEAALPIATWNWANCCTDGGVLGSLTTSPFNSPFTMTIAPSFPATGGLSLGQITKWEFLTSGPGNPIDLDLTETLTIKR